MASKRKKALLDHAERTFSKHYRLKSENDVFKLPAVDVMYSTEPFTVPQLVAMKEELNKTKCLLNDKEIVQWRRHTGKTNPCGLVVKHLRDVVNPELCTQAWAKFYEIVSSNNVIPASCIEKGSFNSLHLCEAPGAFVASLNHYVKSRFEGMEWTWLASTLNPFYEGNDTKRMIEGEKFILETEGHWNFGEWYDGDLMNRDNLEHLQQAMRDLGKADVVSIKMKISFTCLYIAKKITAIFYTNNYSPSPHPSPTPLPYTPPLHPSPTPLLYTPPLHPSPTPLPYTPPL